jgi:DNA recombination protein RmuC
MRATVDEKLQSTLQSRLTESFGQVTDQLTKVHAGLGEMTKLSAGVDDLSRIFTNVKSRGQFAEAMLDNLLKQMLAPSQFVRNAQVKPETQEVVEFAVRFPGPNGDVLLPIDSKFPRETWDRLESSYDAGSAAEIAAARKAFESAIRTEAKRICSKYINEPITTPNAVMFLPTEGLYAEVMRRDGLHDDIQQNCHVMIAGPSNLSAILTSFQMVFSLVNLQKKGSEIRNVLATARGEFGKFGVLVDKMDKQVGTVQNTISDLGRRTRAINKTLSDVSSESPDAVLPEPNVAAFDGLLPMLAAGEEEE